MEPLEIKQMTEHCISTAEVLKSLAHPLRLQILCHLSEGNKTGGDLERLTSASQSQVSQFLGRMKAEGILSSRRSGNFVWYQIDDAKVKKLIKAMHWIFCTPTR